MLVAARRHAALHRVLGHVSMVVASDRVACVLRGLLEHGHQSVHLRRDERELQAELEAAHPATDRTAAQSVAASLEVLRRALRDRTLQAHDNGKCCQTRAHFANDEKMTHQLKQMNTTTILN